MMAIGQHPSPLDASGPNLDRRCNFWADLRRSNLDESISEPFQAGDSAA